MPDMQPKTSWLQWGRGLEPAETIDRSTASLRTQLLQWGRGLEPAET